MKRKTKIQIALVTLFLLVALAAMSGCKRAEVAPTGPVTTFRAEVPEEETSQIKPSSALNKLEDGSFFVIGTVKELSGRRVVVQLEGEEEYELDIPTDAKYRLVVEESPTKSESSDLKGDNFSKIIGGKTIGAYLKEGQDGTLYVDTVLIIERVWLK